MTREIMRSANSPRCSVVVTTWKRPVLLRDTLNSLLCQTYPDFEVIVVCDGEDADVRGIAREFQHDDRIHWAFHAENRGLPAARNTGAREAGGDILLFLDDDVLADRDLIATHMLHHQKASPGHHLAVTSLAAEDRETQLSSYVDECLHENWKKLLASFRAKLSAGGGESIGEEIERIICFGLNSSIRRDLFLKHGGFNEHFRASDEESELGLRLYLAGVEFIFEPQSLLRHRNSKDLASYFQSCWRASGALHVYRVFNLGQRNAQTRRLFSVFHGYWLNRMAARAAWYFSGSLCAVAKRLEVRANQKRSRADFSVWARSAQAGEYWSSAKAAGCTLAQLKIAAGSPHCAMVLHSLSQPASGPEATYYTSPQRFRRLMRWFLAAGYQTVTTDQWLMGGSSRKRVLLTFDDGYDDLYTELLPFLIEHGLTAVIYLVVDGIGGTNLWNQKLGLRARNILTWAQIREMQKYGIEFGSHTLTHPWLPSLSYDQLRHEVADSKRRLEDALGVEVASFAYPSGGLDRRVRSAVAEAGYRLAFTLRPGLNWWNDPLCQRRAEINEHTSVLDFAFQLRTGYGFTRTISERLKALERDLPTSALRGFAGTLQRMGHNALHKPARETADSANS